MTKLSSLSSRLIASRVVFRHRARARHRGIDKSDQRAKSATTADPYPRTNSHLKATRRCTLPLAACRPARRSPVPSGHSCSHSRFSCSDWEHEWRDWEQLRRLAVPTRRQGRQLVRATRTPGRRLAAGRATTRCCESPGPGPTRRCEMRRATTACAATSSAVPS